MLATEGYYAQPTQIHLRKACQAHSTLSVIKSKESTRNGDLHKKRSSTVNNIQRKRSKSCLNPITSKTRGKKINCSSPAVKCASIPRPSVLHSYLSYSDIMQYLDYIQLRFMNFVKVHTLGTTFERRAIKCVEIDWSRANRIRSAPFQHLELKQLEDMYGTAKTDRNIVFIEGGTHAREWITVTVALNCIHQLTERNVRHREIMRKLKFYIVPLVNPDGYEYSRTVNRRWRKNRRPSADGDCIGTDCNRNYDFHWNAESPKTKRNTYQGDKPFSEHETKALAAMLNRLGPNLLFYLSLHSYAQSIMYPWGYSKLKAKNAKFMETVAVAGRNAIKAFSGRHYRVGSISQVTKRKISGSVVDYAYGAVKIPLALVMELPSHEYGFQPPQDKIYPLGIESWQGIKEMCKAAFSLKFKIEEKEEKTITKAFRDDVHPILTKVDSNLLNTSGDSFSYKSQKENDTLNVTNSAHIIHQKEMSKGIITSMLDVTS